MIIGYLKKRKERKTTIFSRDQRYENSEFSVNRDGFSVYSRRNKILCCWVSTAGSVHLSMVNPRRLFPFWSHQDASALWLLLRLRIGKEPQWASEPTKTTIDLATFVVELLLLEMDRLIVSTMGLFVCNSVQPFIVKICMLHARYLTSLIRDVANSSIIRPHRD